MLFVVSMPVCVVSAGLQPPLFLVSMPVWVLSAGLQPPLFLVSMPVWVLSAGVQPPLCLGSKRLLQPPLCLACQLASLIKMLVAISGSTFDRWKKSADVVIIDLQDYLDSTIVL